MESSSLMMMMVVVVVVGIYSFEVDGKLQIKVYFEVQLFYKIISNILLVQFLSLLKSSEKQ